MGWFKELQEFGWRDLVRALAAMIAGAIGVAAYALANGHPLVGPTGWGSIPTGIGAAGVVCVVSWWIIQEREKEQIEDVVAKAVRAVTTEKDAVIAYKEAKVTELAQAHGNTGKALAEAQHKLNLNRDAFEQMAEFYGGVWANGQWIDRATGLPFPPLPRKESPE